MTLLRLDDHEDYACRPVKAGMCSFPDVLAGRVSLIDLAVMNDYLDVTNENERRVRAALERK